MDWYVAVILFIICAVLFFFLGWAVGISVYQKEHMIKHEGGSYMHEDEPIDVKDELVEEKDEHLQEEIQKHGEQSEVVNAMQMLIEGWCDDCEEDVSDCMKYGYCKASFKGGNTDER